MGLFAEGGASEEGGAPEGGAPEGGASECDPRLSPPAPPLPYDEEPEPRRMRIGLYASAGAVAVVTVAVLAAVLLPPDKPQRDDRALPDVPTRAVNAPSGSAAKESTPTTVLPPPSAPASSPSDPPTSHEASPSQSPSGTASDKARPTRPPSRSTARATDSAKSDTPSSDAVLKQGDKGPEVEELQQRLQQLYLYAGETDGTYDAPVTDAVARFQFARGTQKDAKGVYGEETRAALEAETSEPRQHRRPR
ncbi:peptidoglycan-binding protein [Streptomyces sp. NPDC058257]|uniref:peptidoglycan-binding domain-containing protein n=1 Tax=Streptomyces sp. NPDC058257 TaxID=3346409 RepID=UPI0036EBF8FE